MITENKDTFGNYYNVACGKNISLNEIIALLTKYFEKEIKPVYSSERIGDIKHSLASIDKIKKDLKYKPIINFNNGLLLLLKYITK
jgi:UDP-N-acetylglucosamine 4-epimerase